MAEMPSTTGPVEKPVAELISDPVRDPIAEAVLERFVTPATVQFANARPDASHAEMAAAASLYTFIGVALVRISRLSSGLDTALQLPDTSGLFTSDFEFLPTEQDTPDARAAVAAAFASGVLSGFSAPPLEPELTAPADEPFSTPDPGQYL